MLPASSVGSIFFEPMIGKAVSLNMKAYVYLFCTILFSLPLFGQGFATYKVSGTLTQSSNYCGGAAPSQEQLDWHHTPRPYQSMIYVKKASDSHWEQAVIDSARTDENGYFEFWLEPGEYTVLLAEQNDKNYMNKVLASGNKYLMVDETCVRDWFSKGLFHVSVSNEFVEDLNHNFSSACFVPYAIPCLTYTGPYPP